mgnify:CR=1 FL=1|tara:strand:- start:2321 stop:3652 length:1332 start_codon:yes stop_codon:yes gene_type:complete
MIKLFKKAFKSIGKVFKKIGKFIKKGFRAFGKLVNKAGIFGQIGMMVLSMYAGPALFKSLSNSFIGTAFKGAGTALKGLGTAAKTALESSKLGRIVLDGASRIASAASSAKKLTLDQLGSLTKGATNMVKSTMQAAGEKLGFTVGSVAPQTGAAITPELTSVTYTPGSGVTAKASGAITKAAGGEGLRATARAIVDNTTEEIAANFWDAKDLAKGGFTGETFAQRELEGISKLDPKALTPESRGFVTDSIDVDTGQFKNVRESLFVGPEKPSAIPTGGLTEAQKEFMTDTSKYDLVGEFSKQPSFKGVQSPVATIVQGASPTSKFNIEPLSEAQKKGIQISTFDAGLKAGIAAASDPIKEKLQSGTTIAANTAGITQDIYAQAVERSIPSFLGSEYQDASNFLNTHAIGQNYNLSQDSWDKNAYHDWLAGAYENQADKFSYGV